MSSFLALKNKISQGSFNNSTIHGVSFYQWAAIYNSFLKDQSSKDLFIFDSEESAEKAKRHLKNSVLFPGLSSNPYSSIVPSLNSLNKRFEIVNKLIDGKISSIVTSQDALSLKLPPKQFFSERLSLSISDIISPQDLSSKLVEFGYRNVPVLEGPGTFVIKGEVFDLYPIGKSPFRIYYFDDMIEEIFCVDIENLKTDRTKPKETISIYKTSTAIFTDENILNFRSNITKPSIRAKADYRNEIIAAAAESEHFDDFPIFSSAFFKESTTLEEYLDDFNIHFIDLSSIDYNILQDSLRQSYTDFSDELEDSIKPKPEYIYNFNPSVLEGISINEFRSNIDLEKNYKTDIELGLLPFEHLVSKLFPIKHTNQVQKFNQIVSTIADLQFKKIKIYIYCNDPVREGEIKYILTSQEGHKINLNDITFVDTVLESGFYYKNDHTLLLSDTDFFGTKIKKASSKRSSKQDLFADQIATLKDGDYIIHKDHGVGIYKGIQTLDLNGTESDYILLYYADNDKVYVPVYKLSLLQKHSEGHAQVKVSNLKSKKFDQEKSRVKNSVKKLAFDLLELQAKRYAQKGFQFTKPDHSFLDFELSFKYEETPDQKAAIDDIISDMTSSRPMDRLVCGDVGFGKTEVAMRAAYKAVLDAKQVGVLVPTTVLAFQHYNTFVERFKNFPINIEFISRFKSAKEVQEILTKLSEGKIDILIGTHKLFSANVKFHDLGLLVIDEEQRFGVGHKEKLKLLKETVDTLTLTATPIPRTMQMSFLGIKELSLIKTAPPKRQSIKTFVVKENHQTMRTAIKKELSRGGQVFIVHNKVQDMESYVGKIKSLVPEARTVFAHGQMSEKELEKRISDFYNYKYDILVSTTIIESGIDIPRANTMIIDRADTYGLSQLHQLRGRIGRSDKKAYAYFMVPNYKKISDVASKRLKALQTYAEIGGGFSLATSDLEIRGSGDILGPEQSGHISNIGLELYMELLQDAIKEIKGEDKTTVRSNTVEILTPFTSSIPKKYIENTGIRLKYYKILSHTSDLDQLADTKSELIDQYGNFPPALENLYGILESRILLSKVGVSFIKVKTKTIELKFNQAIIDSNASLRDNILDFFMKRPKIYKIKPDFSIICNFKDKIIQSTLLDFAKHIAEQIKTC